MPCLADLLVATPPAGSQISSEIVGDVLASIALAGAGIAVLPDGRYRLGPLSGRFAKPEAEFIGATAREHRRQRLLAELDAQIAALTVELAAVREDLERVAAEQASLDDIVASLPPVSALLAGRDALVFAVATANTTRDAADRDEVVARETRRRAERTLAALVSLGVNAACPRAARASETAIGSSISTSSGPTISSTGCSAWSRAGRASTTRRGAWNRHARGLLGWPGTRRTALSGKGIRGPGRPAPVAARR